MVDINPSVYFTLHIKDASYFDRSNGRDHMCNGVYLGAESRKRRLASWNKQKSSMVIIIVSLCRVTCGLPLERRRDFYYVQDAHRPVAKRSSVGRGAEARFLQSQQRNQGSDDEDIHPSAWVVSVGSCLLPQFESHFLAGRQRKCMCSSQNVEQNLKRRTCIQTGFCGYSFAFREIHTDMWVAGTLLMRKSRKVR